MSPSIVLRPRWQQVLYIAGAMPREELRSLTRRLGEPEPWGRCSSTSWMPTTASAWESVEFHRLARLVSPSRQVRSIRFGRAHEVDRHEAPGPDSRAAIHRPTSRDFPACQLAVTYVGVVFGSRRPCYRTTGRSAGGILASRPIRRRAHRRDVERLSPRRIDLCRHCRRRTTARRSSRTQRPFRQ